MSVPVVKHLASDGFTEQAQQSWGPFLSGATPVVSAKVKFGVENVDGRALGATPLVGLFLKIVQVGLNDGNAYYFTSIDTSNTLSKPWGNGADGSASVAVGGTGGVWAATGTYGVTITALNATGETIGSTEATFTITALTQKATYTWVQTPGATMYKVYRTSSPGTYGASTLRATIGSGSTISFQDDGTATTAGTPPVANTTGGAGPVYGTPPADASFDQTDKTIATAPAGMAIGQQWFYWAQVQVPANTSEVGNTRTLQVTPTEE